MQQASPSRASCLGCRTYFAMNQRLTPSSQSYFECIDIPLRNPKHKVDILRMICAFLNTKGGFIFLGVDSVSFQVKGLAISTKQQDEFKLYIKGMVERLHPKVDLSNREEVQTTFVPIVTSGKEPVGKFVFKIVVKQGQRDRVYTYSQKVKLNPRGNEPEEFELHSGFVARNGFYQRLQGVDLIDQIMRKAKHETPKYRFHQGCNPKPVQFHTQNRFMSFKGFDTSEQQSNLVALLKANLRDQAIQFQSRYNAMDHALIIQFHSENQAKKVEILINDNIRKLKQVGLSLKYHGIGFNCYVFEKDTKAQIQPQVQYIPSKNTSNHGQNRPQTYFTISGYSSNSKSQFLRVLRESLPKTFDFRVEIFNNSINLEQREPEYHKIIKNSLQKIPSVHKYSIFGKLTYGRATGHILVYNFAEGSRQELQGYISRLLKNRVRSVTYRRERDQQNCIDAEASPKAVNDCLDMLVQNTQIKEFKAHGKDSRIVFVIECV